MAAQFAADAALWDGKERRGGSPQASARLHVRVGYWKKFSLTRGDPANAVTGEVKMLPKTARVGRSRRGRTLRARRTAQCGLMVEIRRYLLFSSTTTFSSGVVPTLFVACLPALPKFAVPAFASRTSL